MTQQIQKSAEPELLVIEQAQRMLAACRSVDQAKGIRDKARAILVYNRERGAGAKAAGDVAEIVARAEIRIGELLRETPKATGTAGLGRPQLGGARTAPPNQPPPLAVVLGMEPGQTDAAKKLSAKTQRLAALTEAQQEEHIAAARLRAEAAALGQRPQTANFSSESNEWYTPARYIDAARAALGGTIDLDPASCEQANQTVGAARILTHKDDGLNAEWHGRVWLNPPYGTDRENGAGAWLAKAVTEYATGRVTACVVLVNAVTDRKWFQPAWGFAVCFTDHRIQFYTPAGTPQSPVSGNAFVYLGPDVPRFARSFADIGPVVQRVTL